MEGTFGFPLYLDNMLTIISLLKTYAPQGVYFNENEVCQYGYVYEFRQKNFYIEFHVIQVNGLWIGVSDYMYPLFGGASPLMENCDKHYTTLEECVKDLCDSVLEHTRFGFDFQNVAYGDKVVKLVEEEFNRLLSSQDLLKEFTERSFFVYG